ncbi:geranylgeranylglycerol-phosphate geranylgeranyltransferase [Leptolyngbya sp. NK1-12]|uniref:Geranylgeranylglycerol-phosphate geranylgeranyltransferase n=1 Tax=Leptolyngbya sp. NK1-12 TaxID=2547451 RepID=A0AA97AP10_9CYAN|nr:geranylgeranylglycerol-phosphate geranylgeranyltransferase [Leptolyngbya sp. NK1-12]WNZ27377.1 geranylgeranylglycerol-phosphate geranylgeranyltransferase [Leptolyngbya sp. NK1-12]
MLAKLDGIDSIQALVHLLRLPVAIVAGMAGWATVYALDKTLPLSDYLLTATVLALMFSAACVINDYWDVEKDRIDHPERPLPSGNLSLPEAWWLAVGLFGLAVLAAIPLGIYPLLLVAISIVLLWNYSHILLVNGILGNLVVAAIVSALIFLGSLVVGQPFAMLYPTGFLFCYTLAKELIWDVHDAEGDRSQGVVTVANRWGANTAFFIAWGLVVLLIISIPIALFYLPMVHPLVFGGFASVTMLCLGIAFVQYQQQRSDHAYQRLIAWERLSMLFGVVGLLGAAPA